MDIETAQAPLQEKKIFTEVTPLSKYLAMTLFIALPFIGGWVGYTYAPEKIIEIEKIVETSPTVVTENGSTSIADSTEAYRYINTNLNISFVVAKPLYERSSNTIGGAYLTSTSSFISEEGDPHIYEDAECAHTGSYRLACDIGFEIQKHPPFSDFKAIGTVLKIDNSEFTFYKNENVSGPGWALWYSAVSKSTGNRYAIASESSSANFIETEVLPTFKEGSQ